MENFNLNSNLLESTQYINSITRIKPKIAVILGSGLGDFVEIIKNRISINTREIPKYPISTVVGHKGKIIFGKIDKIPVMIFQGRIHFYETGNLEKILYPIYIAKEFGVKILVVTNAAGGINRHYKPGDLMLITDQINLTFENPLKFIPKQSYNTSLYDPNLISIALKVAKSNRILLQQGVYCGVKGPSYETAAEIEMFRRIGADAVGMSTVNEVLLANALGIRVLGISCITNMSTGILPQKLSHNEVTEVAKLVNYTFSLLLTECIRTIT